MSKLLETVTILAAMALEVGLILLLVLGGFGLLSWLFGSHAAEYVFAGGMVLFGGLLLVGVCLEGGR